MQWPMGGESLPHAVFPHSHELISVAAHSQGSNSTCEAVHGSNGYFANGMCESQSNSIILLTMS
jgi:hypothetical protein